MIPREIEIQLEASRSIQREIEASRSIQRQFEAQWEAIQSIQATIQPAIDRFYRDLLNIERHSSENRRWNTSLDKIVSDVQCPACQGQTVTEVLNPLPDVQGLDVVDRKTLVCRKCNLGLYLPPFYHLRLKAKEFLDAARQLQPDGPLYVIAYLLHHAAELYIKALGSYEIEELGRDNDDNELERVEGNVLERTKHELAEIYKDVPTYMKKGLEKDVHRRELIQEMRKLPSGLSIAFRYGVSNKSLPGLTQYKDQLLLRDDRDLIKILGGLGDALERFVARCRLDRAEFIEMIADGR